jgi:hypothetical protein
LEIEQGNRIKKEAVRAKSAKHAKDSERGLIQAADHPTHVSYLCKMISLHLIILAILARAILYR